MNIPCEICDLAYRFFDAAIWKNFHDDEVFGVRLESGEIVYCSVLGRNGECFALNMYVGDEGWNSYLWLLHDAMSMSEQQEMFFSQQCLQVSFDLKIDLSQKSFEQLKLYAKSRNISLKGPRYANFLKFEKMRTPWPVSEESDFTIIKECLEALFFVNSRLTAHKLEIQPFFTSCKIPIFSKKGNSYTKRSKDVFGVHKFKFKNGPGKTFTMVKKARKQGTLYCDMVLLPMSISLKKDEAPFFPYGLMAINENGILLLMKPILNYESKLEEFIETLVMGMIQKRFFPQKIIVRNERTFRLLVAFCYENGIEIELGQLEFIDDAYSDMLANLGR